MKKITPIKKRDLIREWYCDYALLENRNGEEIEKTWQLVIYQDLDFKTFVKKHI